MRKTIFLILTLLFSVEAHAEQVFDVNTLAMELPQHALEYRAGDDPHWAVDESESSWQKLDAATNPRQFQGAYWFRTRIRYTWWRSDTSDLVKPAVSILTFSGSAYEIYINGIKIASEGRLPPDPHISDSAWARIYNIPEELHSARLLLAIRIWYDPAFKARNHDRRRIPSIRLGNYDHLVSARDREKYDYTVSKIPAYALATAFLLVGIYHLNLYNKRRQFIEYLWYGLFSCFFFVNNLSTTLWRTDLVSYSLGITLARFSASLICLMGIKFLLHILSIRVNRWVKLYNWFCVLVALTSFTGPTEIVSGFTGDIIFAVMTGSLILYSCLLVFRESRRHHQDALTIRTGIYVMGVMEIAVILRPFLLFPDSLGVIVTQLPNIGFAAFIFSMAIALSNRFARVYNEVDTLNRDLEQKVDERTRELVSQRDEIEQKNQHILDSIIYAESIQKSILPDIDFMKQELDLFIFYRPKDIVSGDFYWYHKTQTCKLLAVLDCTGHGVPGAMMSMTAESLLTQIVLEQSIGYPEQVLLMLDEGLCRMVSRESEAINIGLDIVLCRIEQHQILFSGAGRSLYYSDPEGRIVTFNGERTPLGSRKKRNRVFGMHTIPIHPGMMIYLTTDGFAHQNGKQRPKFGNRAFKELLERIVPMSLDEQRAVLEQELESFRGFEQQRDDITILGVRLA